MNPTDRELPALPDSVADVATLETVGDTNFRVIAPAADYYYTADQMRAFYHQGREDGRAVVGWKPIETAPKDGSTVILGFAGSHSEEGFWMNDPERNHWGEIGWFSSDADVLCERPASPTHWMPLPSPPAALEAQ